MTHTTPGTDARPTSFEVASASFSEEPQHIPGANSDGQVKLYLRKAVIARCIENHPGLSPEKAEQMLRAYGFL